MQKNSRFIASIVKTSRKVDVQMPWARGARRAEVVARRKGLLAVRKTA